MKRLTLFIALSVVILSLTVCRPTEYAPDTHGTFKDGFSIGTIVQNNEQYLLPGSRVLSGAGSGPEPFTQKREEIVFQIDSANLPMFLQSIKADTNEAIINSGAKIDGSGSGGQTDAYFSFDYSENDKYGVINVWGVRGEGTTYYLIALITER